MPGKGVLRIKILGDAKGVDSAVGIAVDKVKAGALAMGAAFIAGVGQAMDIEAATDKMSASLGLSAQESEKLGGVAGKLYANAFGESMEDVTAAITAVRSSIRGMGTASAAEIEDVTAKVMNLATAFELDVARSAQVAGQLISSGMVKTATEALDVLTVGLQSVPAAVREDLLDALDEYGPFMNTLGITGVQAMDLLIASSKKGMYGIDKLGDSLKEFTIRATDMSAASKVGFDILGMSQEDMSRKLLAGGQTAQKAFSQIVNGLLGIKDPVKQSQAALALFGTPLEDLNVSEIPKFLSSLTDMGGGLGDVSGAADKLGQTLNDNAKTNLTAFWRQLQMAFVDILGGKVIPVVNSFASFLASTVGPILRAIGTVLGATVVPALSAVAGWAQRNADVLGFLGSMLAGGIAGYMAFRGAIMAITGAMKIWSAVTKGLTVAQTLLNIVMRANPIGIVITLVGALVAGIIYLWNKSAKFRNFFKAAWEFVQPAIRAVGSAIGAVIGFIQDAIGFAEHLIDVASRALGLTSQGSFGGGGVHLPKRAGGGPVEMGRMYLVGERGPELFLANQSGMILSNPDTSALMAQAQAGANATLAGLATSASTAPSGGVAYVTQTFNFPNYLGTKQDLVRELRASVRTSGRGSAERFFQGVNA